MKDVVKALREALGADAVLTGEDVHQRQAGIWRRDTVQAKAIVRPRTTAEVSAALRICHDLGQTVVAHGGLTGLVEGSLTVPG
jgi:FAD/FMN-containing dehydrogenase